MQRLEAVERGEAFSAPFARGLPGVPEKITVREDFVGFVGEGRGVEIAGQQDRKFRLQCRNARAHQFGALFAGRLDLVIEVRVPKIELLLRLPVAELDPGDHTGQRRPPRFRADGLGRVGEPEVIEGQRIEARLDLLELVHDGARHRVQVLVQRGHEITIFESKPAPGGLLVYGIPNFKLPKDIWMEKWHEFENAGVKFVGNTYIGKDKTIDDLFNEGFDAVFIGVGSEVDAKMEDTPGTDLPGVYEATDFLIRGNVDPRLLPASGYKPLEIGKRVAVIGGGDTASDCLRTTLRLDLQRLAEGVIERRPNETGRGYTYHLTLAGRDFLPIIEALGEWGRHWSRRDLAANEVDVSQLVWSMERSVRPDAFGDRRTVMQLEFTDQPTNRRRRWFVNETSEAQLCVKDPGFEVDLYLSVRLRDMMQIWRGDLSLAHAMDSGRLKLQGTSQLKRALPACHHRS